MPPLNYVEPPDIPEGMTCAQWRRTRRRARRRLFGRAFRRRPAADARLAPGALPSH
jgi:hypothetical protein